jgi:mycofactocin system glycosyltransferase
MSGPAPTGSTGSTDALAGLRFTPDPSVEVRSGGRVLLGGSPLRVVRLTAAGAEVARLALDGEPIPPGRAASALVRRLLDGGLVHPLPQQGPFGPDAVTVVVPVRGAVPTELLAGLGPVAAVVVVDDASPVAVEVPDRTPEGAPVHVIRRAARGGPAAARNTGLAAVTTPLVAFVDADCVPRPGWLDGLLPHLADPAVAVVAPRIVPVDLDTGASVLARYEATRSALDLGPRPARVRARSRVSFVPSAALLARVDVLRELGGFDTDMAVGEDVDLVWRLDEGGHTVRYEPAATVAHRHRTTFRAWARRRYDYGTSAGPLATRHPGALVPVEASPWSVAVWGLGVAGHPAIGLGVAGATVVALARKLGAIEDAPALAARLAGQGHLAAGKLLAQAVVRPWWPVSLLIMAVVPSRRLRRALLLAAVVPPVIEWATEHPSHGPVTYVGLRLADDVAYSAGVWVGAVRSRTTEPLLPDLTSWPRPSRYSAWRAGRMRPVAATSPPAPTPRR